MPRYFGSAASTPPVTPVVFTLDAAPLGGWPNLGGAPLYHAASNYSYVGGPNNAGGIFVTAFNNATGVATVSTLSATGSTTNDQHNKPGLALTSTDKLMAVFCDHDSLNMYIRITNNTVTADPTLSGGWNTAVNLDSQLGSTRYTYPAIFNMGSDHILFYRDNDGLSNWEISTSTDDGATWSSFTNLFYATRAYALAYQTTGSRIDFFVSDGSYCEDAASLYHLYWDGTDFRKSDTSIIGGSPPFAFGAMTKIYDGATAGVRVPGACVNDGSTLAVVFPVQTGTCSGHLGADEDYKIATAAIGSATWTVETVASAVGALTFEYTEGLLAIDPADINHLIVSKRAVSSLAYPFHMYDYSRASIGDPWTITGVDLSGDPSMYPWFVRNYETHLQYVYPKGTFTSQSVFNNATMGFGTPP